MKTFNSFLKLALPLMLGLVCLTAQADNLTVYQKVKSTDELVSGDKYIIVREDPEQSYAMGNLVNLEKKSSGFLIATCWLLRLMGQVVHGISL